LTLLHPADTDFPERGRDLLRAESAFDDDPPLLFLPENQSEIRVTEMHQCYITI